MFVGIFDEIEYVTDDSRDDSHIFIIKIGPVHRKRFSRPALPVGENGSVVAAHDVVDDFFSDDVVDEILVGVGVEDFVENELIREIFVVFARFQLNDFFGQKTGRDPADVPGEQVAFEIVQRAKANVNVHVFVLVRENHASLRMKRFQWRFRTLERKRNVVRFVVGN
jgi:hypothetical protein